MNQKISFDIELSQRINQWFQLIPKGCKAHHVREMMNELECTPGDTILDPFCGEGSTLIESQIAGLNAVGFEINPFLHFVSKTITTWDIDLDKLDRQKDLVTNQFLCRSKGATLATLEHLGLAIPPIHKPFSWWREDILVNLLILSQAINQQATDPFVRHFLRLALASILVPELSNTKLEGHLLLLVERQDDSLDVLKSFTNKVSTMIIDLAALAEVPFKKTTQSYLQDATNLDNLSLEGEINCVITAPPYPARFSYVWNTLPHLYFFGYHTSPREPSALDEKALGGTWGDATYKLMRERVAVEHSTVAKHISPIADQFREEDPLAANYLIKYFNLITRHLIELDKLAQRNFRVAYMVGSAELGGTLINTGQLLGSILDDFGYSIRKIKDCGNYVAGRSKYTEKIVYAWK